MGDIAIIFYGDRWDVGSISATTEATGYDAEYARAFDPQYGWRSTAITLTYLTFSYVTGETRPIACVYVLGSNMSTAALTTFKLQAAKDAIFATYDEVDIDPDLHFDDCYSDFGSTAYYGQRLKIQMSSGTYIEVKEFVTKQYKSAFTRNYNFGAKRSDKADFTDMLLQSGGMQSYLNSEQVYGTFVWEGLASTEKDTMETICKQHDCIFLPNGDGSGEPILYGAMRQVGESVEYGAGWTVKTKFIEIV